MNISDFSAWLDGLLEPQAFKDYCVDGLCVEASEKVTRVVTGVSFRDRLIDAAIENGADCIFVHHPNGFWQGENRVLVGKFGERMRRLMQNGISLYGYHLPLDGQPEFGNNVLIAKAFGLKNLEGFIREGERTVGYVGEFEEPVSRDGFVELACGVFEHGVQHALMYGKEFVRKVSEAAQRSEHTVRMWLAQAQPIEPLAKKPIAQVLLGREDVTPEDINSLFSF